MRIPRPLVAERADKYSEVRRQGREFSGKGKAGCMASLGRHTPCFGAVLGKSAKVLSLLDDELAHVFACTWKKNAAI
jgi:hypothetical protein